MPAARAQTLRASVRSRPETLVACLSRWCKLACGNYTLSPIMSIIRQFVNIFDHAHSEAQARIKLTQLRQDINALEDRDLEKLLTVFDAHWDQAFRYLRKKGMGKHRRGSNSESG